MNDLSRVEKLFPAATHVVKKIHEDFPEYENNVFIIMRFKKDKNLDKITRTIRENLLNYGFWGIRADDKAYTDDLWLNVCGHMFACKYGIAVFEDLEEREFNPNIAIEYGFMMGLGKRILMLKEERMPKVPTDITGKLWKPFSMFKIKESIGQRIEQWIVDIGRKPSGTNAIHYNSSIPMAAMIRSVLIDDIHRNMELTKNENFRYNKILERISKINIGNNPDKAVKQLKELFENFRADFRKSRMEEVGRALNDLDKEMEIDMEEFTERYYLNKVHDH